MQVIARNNSTLEYDLTVMRMHHDMLLCHGLQGNIWCWMAQLTKHNRVIQMTAWLLGKLGPFIVRSSCEVSVMWFSRLMNGISGEYIIYSKLVLREATITPSIPLSLAGITYEHRWRSALYFTHLLHVRHRKHTSQKKKKNITERRNASLIKRRKEKYIVLFAKSSPENTVTDPFPTVILQQLKNVSSTSLRSILT